MIKHLFFTFLFIFSCISLSAHQTGYSNINYDTLKNKSPEEIVQQQLEYYNARDIDGFMSTYAADVILYEFPATIIVSGQEAMRKRYQTMFSNTPDLFCEIKKRILIGSKVIDHEYVLKNGTYINAVAIYEVKDGKITSVTFIR